METIGNAKEAGLKIGGFMYRIALCDDDKNYLELTRNKIQEYCNTNNINIILKSYDYIEKIMLQINKI